MPRLKIADVVCDIDLRFEETAHWYNAYQTEEPVNIQRVLSAEDESIDYLVQNGVGITPAIAENMVLSNMFNTCLIKYNGSYIHSSALKYNDKVYLFSGPSGVGKSTHTKKWCRLYPQDAKVINDDKPSFRIIDGKCMVYGTPFAGGTDIQENDKGELGAIVFLEQSDENRLERLDSSKAITYLFQQTPVKRSEKLVSMLLDMYSEIISKYPVYRLFCTDSDEAVTVAYSIVNNF